MRWLFLEKYFLASKAGSIRKQMVEFDKIMESHYTTIGNNSKGYMLVALTIS